MTLSDDEVVGFIDPEERTERFQDDLDDDKPLMPIYRSDLDKHIQDRLRAAEAQREALEAADRMRDAYMAVLGDLGQTEPTPSVADFDRARRGIA